MILRPEGPQADANTAGLQVLGVCAGTLTITCRLGPGCCVIDHSGDT